MEFNEAVQLSLSLSHVYIYVKQKKMETFLMTSDMD